MSVTVADADTLLGSPTLDKEATGASTVVTGHHQPWVATVAYVTQSTGDIEPHDGIDPHRNPETQATEQNQSNARSRAADSGPPPTDAPEAGSAPQLSGTAAGNPLDGVTIDDSDAEKAVSGDTGPEHPGTRRSS